MWLPPALLLLCLPGCLFLTGPRFVTGTTGGSLTVRCWYEKDYKGYNKYWCRGQYDTDCDKIVETKGKEQEERNGRMSIRDNADDLTLTVTMRNLNAADAGSYWCKIQTVWILDEWSRDPSFQVQVSVSPAPCTSTGQTTRPTAPPTFPAVIAEQNCSTRQVCTHCPGVPLSTVYFLFLIFLKLPLFLSALGAVLWVSRCQRGPERHRVSLSRGIHHAVHQLQESPVQEHSPADWTRETCGPCAPGQGGSSSAWILEGLRPSGGIVPVPQGRSWISENTHSGPQVGGR